MLLFSAATRAALTAEPDDLVDFGDAAIRGRLAHTGLWSLESVSDALLAVGADDQVDNRERDEARGGERDA